jgi:hypothetical protein
MVDRAWLETAIPPVFGKGKDIHKRRPTPNTVVGLLLLKEWKRYD